MSNITKRTNIKGELSYLIRVFIDEDCKGKQRSKSVTWKPTTNMKTAQIDKELNRQATLFEEKVKKGFVCYDGNTRFEDYAKKWIENAQLAPTTRARYIDLLRRINLAIGHIKLERIQAHHLEELYRNLKEGGIKLNTHYAIANGLCEAFKDKGITTNDKFAKIAGISAATVETAMKGKHIREEKAQAIASASDTPINKIFNVIDNASGLSGKTVLHHHRLISAILGKAVFCKS